MAAYVAPNGDFNARLPVSSKPSTADPVWMWAQTTSACSSTCGNGTRTQTYACQDASQMDGSGGFGAPEDEAQCVSALGAKPAGTTEACSVYTSCSFDWVKPAEVVTPTAPGRAGCGQVNRTFSPYCQRGDGTILSTTDNSLCSSDPDYADVAAGTPDAAGYNRSAVETSACGPADNDWDVGAWGAFSSGCSSTATHTRTVICKRKFDGAVQADAACATAKPATSETMANYASCTYSWFTGSWSSWWSGCANSTGRSRVVQCKRSDNSVAPDADCAALGPKPATIENGSNYSNCYYSFEFDAFGACQPDNTQTRNIYCKRSNGDRVSTTSCGLADGRTTYTTSCTAGDCALMVKVNGNGAATSGTPDTQYANWTSSGTLACTWCNQAGQAVSARATITDSFGSKADFSVSCTYPSGAGCTATNTAVLNGKTWYLDVTAVRVSASQYNVQYAVRSPAGTAPTKCP